MKVPGMPPGHRWRARPRGRPGWARRPAVRRKRRMTLSELNALPRNRFTAFLGGVFEGAPWVAYTVWAARPFAARAALYRAMVEAVRRAPRARQLALLRAYPEAKGLDCFTPAEAARWEALNRRYRERFGFPFIMGLTDLDKRTILKALEARLQRSVEAEVQEALEQASRIAALRLEERIEEA